jgi:hypothetical protein
MAGAVAGLSFLLFTEQLNYPPENLLTAKILTISIHIVAGNGDLFPEAATPHGLPK